ncbi:hypothetical protein CKK33_08600 [Mucilaginibacter sp. MD40]|uniref:hypothetical protein n=1 Tax=Mucilaginibacter sp. MD40 TaxID=2029590 RepID=UPI000BAC7E5A|nr:hypothetical protein [Mucilaginibacter sp. MD40]PAW93549.1 hypothetical protein CKK33_08600 [Mucilaginibacter sp. MD40]
MLTENDVINTLETHLISLGYSIKKKSTTIQTGIDLVAENSNETLYIEAKGETSSKKGTNRYGLTFSPNQIKSHVARAILTSMIISQQKPAGSKTKVAIALPDNFGHRNLSEKILQPLKQLSITIFLIKADGSVSVL